jgi:uncharacterized protein (DUF885 family)
MKVWVICAVLGLLAVPSLLRAADETSSGEDSKLNAFFQAYLDELFRMEPVTATRSGDHGHDGELDDLSADARRANLERDRRALAELPKRVEYAKLTRSGQVDYEILRTELTRNVWLAENFKPFENDPRIYGDYLTESVYLLFAKSSLPREANFKNALARMARIPKVVDAARATLGNPPRVKVETAIRQTKGAIDFYSKEVYLLAGQPVGEGELAKRAQPIIEALRSYLEFLEKTILPRSTDDWRIGEAKFARKLELELDSGISPAELLAEAKSEADRVEREMAVIARILWSSLRPGEAVPPDDPVGRRRMIRTALDAVAADHGTPEGLVADATACVAEIKRFIAEKDILRLPDPDRCQIIEMPEFQRGNSVAFLSSAPPLDPAAPSQYAISPPPSDWTDRQVTSYLQEYNKAMIKILTIHEAYPGHYVQLEYSNRCPSAIRRVLQSGTFAEGWAVYTEQMMLDQGYGSGDLRLRLQQLKFYLRAVVNAILDHEMHVGHMTDDEAMELLVGRAFQTEGEALGKIIRSKQTACQLSTYFAGRTAFYRLRQAIHREQGESFRLGRFHEAVLAHGTVPVKYLPELVRKSLSTAP